MRKLSITLITAFLALLFWRPIVEETTRYGLRWEILVAGWLLLSVLTLIGIYELVALNAEIAANHKIRKKSKTLPTPEVPEDIRHSLDIYNGIAIRNYWSHRILGIISLSSSLALTGVIGFEVGKGFIPVYVTKVLAFISSLSIGIVLMFNMVEKGNNARRAFRLLLDGIMRFEYCQAPMEDLIKVYRESETILGEDDFTPTSLTSFETPKTPRPS